MKKKIFLLFAIALISSTFFACKNKTEESNKNNTLNDELIQQMITTNEKILDYNRSIDSGVIVVPSNVDFSNDESKITTFAHISNNDLDYVSNDYLQYKVRAYNKDNIYSYEFFDNNWITNKDIDFPLDNYVLLNLSSENIELIEDENSMIDEFYIDDFYIKRYKYSYKNESNEILYKTTLAINLYDEMYFIGTKTTYVPFKDNSVNDDFVELFKNITFSY